MDRLVGAAEIAERVGATRHQAVRTWRQRYADFPEPVVMLRRVILWNWPEVEAWARARDGCGRGAKSGANVSGIERTTPDARTPKPQVRALTADDGEPRRTP